jgi:hypothetical protein
MNYGEYEVPADEFQQMTQVDLATRFWHNLLNDVRPDWDGSDSTYQVVRQMHPLIDDSEVDLGDLGMHLFNAQTRADEATQELTKLKSIVMDAMGNSKTAVMELDNGETHKIASRQIRGGSPTLIVHRKAH